MSQVHTHNPPRPHTQRAECCVESECLTGLRNHYYVGKRLTPDAFLVEQRYLNGRRQLLNRAIHGTGVVYGYPVTAAAGQIVIGAGLALDAVGRELLWAEATSYELGALITLNDKGAVVPNDDTFPFAHEGCWLLRAHYAEQRVGVIDVPDQCGCERTEWDRVCETVRFSLQWTDCAKCCEPPACELSCECGTGPCCEETRKDDCRPTAAHPVARGGCQCLCDHLTHLSPDPECTRLIEVKEPCGWVYVDVHNGVPLACLRLTRDQCGPWTFSEWIDACGPRRLVKRLDVLFDLIRGCDLTRIVDTGWTSFHRSETPVAWDQFEHSWGYPGSGPDQPTEYWITFSRPVRASTVRADCFAIIVIAGEKEGGWGETFRVPITGIWTEPAPSPPGHVIRAGIRVDSGWVKDAILSTKNRFNYQETLVEVEVRGDYIIDCNGQAVDANPVGLQPVPTGDGTPGGRYLSSFRVAARWP